jgi:hypothetical protein
MIVKVLCNCGCGQEVTKEGNKYIQYHTVNLFKGRPTNEAIEKIREKCLKRKHKPETKEKIRQANIGLKNHMYGKTGNKHPRFGKTHTDEVRLKLSINHYDVSGKNNPNWRGVGENPYCPIFSNKEFREIIFERDNYKCINPNCYCRNSKRITIHHIDYNKMNCSLKNLVTLCNSCNSKANFNRDWHKCWFEAIMYNRYIKGR